VALTGSPFLGNYLVKLKSHWGCFSCFMKDVWQGGNTTFVHSWGANSCWGCPHSFFVTQWRVSDFALLVVMVPSYKRQHSYLKIVGSLFLAIVVKFWRNGYSMCWSPDWVVQDGLSSADMFLTVYSKCFSSARFINGCWQIAGTNWQNIGKQPALDSHPIQGVFYSWLAASCLFFLNQM